MRLTMLRWMGLLWAGLLLVGCGDDGPASPIPLPTPSWASDNKHVGNSNQPKLKVHVDPDATLEVYAGPGCEGEPFLRVQDTSDYYIEFPLTVADNSTTVISVRAVRDDRVSDCSSPFTYTEDSIPPPAPRWAEGNPVLGNEQNIILRMLAGPGTARVSLFDNEECESPGSLSVTPDAEGMASFSVYISYSSTKNYFSAMAVDEAGNVSECSPVHTYVLDYLAPPVPRWSASTPKTSNLNTPTLSVDVEAGAQVDFFANADCSLPALQTVTADESGQASITVTVADDSTSTYSARARDAVGNRSGCSASLKFIEDSQPSAAPSGLSLSPSSPGASTVVFVSGTAAGGDTRALLFTTEGCTGTPIVDLAVYSGSFSLAIDVPSGSTTSFFVATRDAAGNRSACAGPVVYVEDSVAPSTVGAKVANGTGAHVRYQRSDEFFEANWSGFSDSNGVVLYEHALSIASNCQSFFTGSLQTPSRTSTQRTAIPIGEDGPLYHCVRAKDVAGNWSPWVASEGFWTDLTPPALVSTSPSRGAVDVDILAPIRLTFSEPVDVSSFSAEGFSLTVNGSRVATTMACDELATSCAFTPVSALPYRESVHAVLSAPLTDRAGWMTTLNVSLDFTTRGRQWQAPREVRSTRPGLFPDAAIDGQGNALAIWVQGTASGAYRPFVSRAAPHASWEPARELDTVHPGDVERPALAVNEAGVAVAVWELHDGAQVDLYAAEYSPASGWGEAHVLETRAEPVSTPRVAVDARGNALVVWRQSDGTSESLWASRLSVDGGWSSPLLLESEMGATSVPALALEGSGRALAAWLQPDASGTVRVLASRFVPGSGWTPPEQAAASGEGTAVSVAQSAEGSAFLLYRAFDAARGASFLYATRFVPGEGWSATATSLGAAPPGGDEPSVAMDRWGRAMAAWTSPLGGGSSTVSLKRFTPEAGWQSVMMDRGQSVQPSVAADGQGNFHIAWVENVSGVDRVFATRYPEGATTLSAIEVLEPTHGGTSKRPRVRANGAGAALTVWYRDNGGGYASNLVYAAAYE